MGKKNKHTGPRTSPEVGGNKARAGESKGFLADILSGRSVSRRNLFAALAVVGGGAALLWRLLSDDEQSHPAPASNPEVLEQNDDFTIPEFSLLEEDAKFTLPEGETLESLRAGFEKVKPALTQAYNPKFKGMSIGSLKDVLAQAWPKLNSVVLEEKAIYNAVNSYLKPLGYIMVGQGYAMSNDRTNNVPVVTVQSFQRARYAQVQTGQKQRQVLVVDVSADLFEPAASRVGEGGQALLDGGNTVCMYPDHIKNLLVSFLEGVEAAGYDAERYRGPDAFENFYNDLVQHELVHADDFSRFPLVSESRQQISNTNHPLTLTLDLGPQMGKKVFSLQHLVASYTEVAAFGAQMAKARSKSPFNLLCLLASLPEGEGLDIYAAVTELLPYMVLKNSPQSGPFTSLMGKIDSGAPQTVKDVIDIIVAPEFGPQHENAVGKDLFTAGRMVLRSLEAQLRG